MNWTSIRSDFPALSKHTYLNTAGIGITPQPVTEEIQRLFGEWSATGATTPSFREHTGALVARARESAAAMVGASTREIALTGRVAESLHIVVDGLPWRRGDEIITSDEEVLYAPLYRVAREHGVVIRSMSLPHCRDEILDRLEESLSPRTKLIWLSDTTNKTGVHLPARQICDLAHAQGALVMFDGAQTVGQFPVDVKEMGCDFYAMTGYKWLLGPYGCGVCYVNEALIPGLPALRLGSGELDHDARSYTESPSALRFEFGVRNVIIRIGFGAALDYAASIGIDAMHQRSMVLRDHLVSGLDTIQGARVASPRDPQLSSAITCVVVEGADPRDIVEAAWKANVVIVPTEMPASRPDLRGIRISPAFYNTVEDIERVLEVIECIAANGRTGRGRKHG